MVGSESEGDEANPSSSRLGRTDTGTLMDCLGATSSGGEATDVLIKERRFSHKLQSNRSWKCTYSDKVGWIQSESKASITQGESKSLKSS